MRSLLTVHGKNRNPFSQPDLSKIEQRRRTGCDRLVAERRGPPPRRFPQMAPALGGCLGILGSKFENMVNIEKSGGWMVRASMVGRLARTFYVYELDDNKAAELARKAIAATIGETVEAVKLLNIHELTGYGMKPGEVKQIV
jgi:hypothetical protein